MNESVLQTLLADLRAKHGVVGCSAGVLVDGEITTAASGLLNLKTNVECTSDSVFQIGSIGKVFTATLMMQLVDEGRVHLDDTVIEHLPDFAIADPGAASVITVRQLLNHTSGMDGDFFPGDDSEGASTASYVRKMALLPNLYPPGAGPMTYCNAGYVAAGRIIEVRTGMTWPNAVMERICRPLGMPAAFSRPREALRFRCAMGHIADPADAARVIVAPVTFPSLSAAAAGSVLSMSAESLLLFAKAHMADGAYGAYRPLLSATNAQTMREDKVPIPLFSRPGVTHWGLGWSVCDDGAYKMAGHDGATLGQYAYLRTFPERGVAISLLTNSPSAKLFEAVEKTLMNSLMGLSRREDPPQEIVEVSREIYVGDYANIGARYSVAIRDSQLTLDYASRSSNGVSFTGVLEPWRADTFALRTENPLYNGQKVVFVGDNGDRATFIRAGVRMARRTDACQ